MAKAWRLRQTEGRGPRMNETQGEAVEVLGKVFSGGEVRHSCKKVGSRIGELYA